MPDKATGVLSDVVAHLAAVFRYMLPGVLVMGAAYLAYPDWFMRFHLHSNQHLIMLGVITITVGNTWFALNRYGLHQLVDLVLYWSKSNGPARGDKCQYLDDLGPLCLQVAPHRRCLRQSAGARQIPCFDSTSDSYRSARPRCWFPFFTPRTAFSTATAAASF